MLAEYRVALCKWKDGGPPTNDPLHDDQKIAKKEVARYLSKCCAKIKLQKYSTRDHHKHPKRFKTSFSQRHVVHVFKHIVVNSSIVSDLDTILTHWVDHFGSLGESRYTSNPVLQNSITTSAKLEADSFAASDTILDSPIALEEVVYTISHLKRNSSGGPDSLCPSFLALL